MSAPVSPPGTTLPAKGPVMLLTVGGSAQPLISAIRALGPRFVRFAVTVSVGTTKGSITMLEGETGIPSQSGLNAACWDHVVVPHDDPDRTFAILRESLQALRARYPDAELIADYTGGTKSMSAALLNAVVAVPGVQAQFMVGERPDLNRVQSGTEQPERLKLTWLLAEREAARLRAGWARFAYAEAEEGMEIILRDLTGDDAPPEARRELEDLRDVSALFAAWDRFDHAAALRRLNAMPGGLQHALARWRPSLELLCDPDCRRKGGMQCLDLWRNAERRAARQLYDDAVARCYRMLEATAQWYLRAEHGIDTAQMPWESYRQELAQAKIQPREGQKELGGLMPSFRFSAALKPNGLFATFLQQRTPSSYKKDRRSIERELRNMLELRNRSVLAHGFQPIGREGWERFATFCRELFLPQVLKPALEALGLPTDLPQLPQALPARA